MELNDFIATFADAFDDTPKKAFKADTIFKNLDEWGSLTALSVIAEVDDNYEKQITGEDINNAKTIEDLFNIVNSR